jgi:LAO/AO transport system kinase
MTPARPSLAELASGVRAGDRAILSRAITLAESSRADDQELAQELLVELMPATGGAIRLGLTGVPGAGKSTMIEALGMHLIDQGLRVAVLAVDPSSSRTGGSILGDKTRMQRLSMLDDAYIRPTASSGVLGGVARRTREGLLLCEAAGYDVVIVESVGVGQSEAILASLVDCLVLLLVPGAGDELQGIKRGIMESADIVVVNKSDSGREKQAQLSAIDYRHALRLLPPATPGWKTPSMQASALEGTGVAEFWEKIKEHRAHLESTGLLEERRTQQQLDWLSALLDEAVLAEFKQRPGVPEALERARRDVIAGEATAPQAVTALLRLAAD